LKYITTLLHGGAIATACLLAFGLSNTVAVGGTGSDAQVEGYKVLSMNEYVPNQRLGWYGYAPGAHPSFYHSWYLEPKGALCHVVMDEAGIGKDASLNKDDGNLLILDALRFGLWLRLRVNFPVAGVDLAHWISRPILQPRGVVFHAQGFAREALRALKYLHNR
jgi:hypothetical protein